MPQIAVYSPFPDLQKKEFKKLTRTLNYNFRNSLFGLLLGYDKDKKHASLEAYRVHVDELNKWKKQFIAMLKTRNEAHKKKDKNHIDHQIEDLNYPACEDKVKGHLSHLKSDDTFVITSHGNTDVIGTGPFTLNPYDLAQNLVEMGLSKESTPQILIWACNSGSEEDMQGNKVKSYAAEVYRILKEDFGYENIAVIGVAGSIYPGNSQFDLEIFKEIEKRNRIAKTKVEVSNAFSFFMSPAARKRLEINDEDHVFTIVKNANKSRKPLDDNQVNYPRLDFNKSIDSTIEESMTDENVTSSARNRSKSAPSARLGRGAANQ